MTFSTPNPITGWNSIIKSVNVSLSDVNYTATTLSNSSTRMFGVRAELPLLNNSKNRKWYWEIDIIGSTSSIDLIAVGVATSLTTVEPPLNFLSNLPGSLYISDGRVNGIGQIFPTFTGGDNIAFAIDYDANTIEAFKNGETVGFLTEELDSSLEFFPYFASNKIGFGCFLRDGANEEISSNTLTFNLRDPFDQLIPPAIPLDLKFINDIEDTALRSVPYFFTNPDIKSEIIESIFARNLITNVVSDCKQIKFPFNIFIRQDLNPVFWNSQDSANGILLSNNNLTANGSLIGSIRTNSFRTGGKWYFEYEIISGANNISVGVGRSDAFINQFVGSNNHSWGFSNGNLIHDNILIPITETIVDGDIINVAIDLDDNLLWFGINNVFINGGNPITGVNPSFTNVTGIISPMISTQTSSPWGIFAHFSDVDTLFVEPFGFDPFDGTAGPSSIARSSVFWDKNTATNSLIDADNTEWAVNDLTSVFSENNLNVLFNGSLQPYTFSTNAQIDGKKYFEVEVLQDELISLSTLIGLGTLPLTDEDVLSGGIEKSIFYLGSNSTTDNIRSNFGTELEDATSYTAGDIIMVAVDFDNGKVWFGKNNIWSTGGDPATDVGPNWSGILNQDYFYAIIGDNSITGTSQFRGKFNDLDVTFNVPVGFESWDIPTDNAWDPSRKPISVTLDITRKRADGTAGLYSGLASLGRETGKHYFEINVLTLGTLLGNTAVAGIGKNTIFETSFLGSRIDTWSIWQLNGSTFNNNIANSINGISWRSINDTVMVAADLDSGFVWFGINGVWLDGSDPITGLNPRYTNLSGMIFPAYGNDSATFGDMGELEINLLGPFNFTIPSGFDAWDAGAISLGGMIITNDNLTATGIGSVLASESVGENEVEQFYMEFDIDDSTSLISIGIETTLETILYQSDGSLGSFNKGPGITFDPNKASVTWQFFNNNIQVGDIGDIGMVKTTEGKSSGKWYWEIRMEPQSDPIATIIGITSITSSVNNYPGEIAGSGIGFYTLDGTLKNEGVSSPLGSAFIGGDIMNFALDVDAGKLWIGKNGVYFNVGSPSTGVNPSVTGLSGTIFPAIGDFTNTISETVAVTANFGQFFFTNDIPTGFDVLGPAFGSGTFPTYTSGDVIGLGIDALTGNILWSKNQQFINEGLDLLIDKTVVLTDISNNFIGSDFSIFGNVIGDFNSVKFNTSMGFDGLSYIQIENDPSFLFGLGDFTIESWIRTIGGVTIASTWDGGTSHSWIIRHLGDQRIEFWSGAVSAIEPLFTSIGILPKDGNFHHFALTRASGVTRIFADGNQIGSSNILWNNIVDVTAILQIGKQPNSGSGLFLGSMEDFHIVKGTAKYTSNFIPPTAPLTPEINTSMLFNIISNSTTALATISGNKNIRFETFDGSTTANFGDGIFEQNLFDNFEPFGCGINGGFAPVPSITWAELGDGELREQNLRYSQNGLGIRKVSAMLGSSRKVYMEYEVILHDGNLSFGIFNNTFYFDGSLCSPNISTCGPQTLPIVQQGDIVMMAFDELTGEGWFGLNDVWFFSADPAINLNPTMTFIPGDEIFWGVENGPGSQGVNVKANFGSSNFNFIAPLGYTAFDQNVLPGKSNPCSTTLPSLPPITNGLLIVSIEDNTTKGSFPLQRRETPQPINFYFKADTVLSDSINFSTLFAGFDIIPLNFRTPLLSILLLEKIKSLSVELGFTFVITGFNINEIREDNIDNSETTNQGKSAGTIINAIDIDNIADHGILTKDNSIESFLLTFIRNIVIAPFILPSVFNFVELIINFPNTSLPFKKTTDFDMLSTLQNTPVSVVIQDESFFIVNFDFTRFNAGNLPKWSDLLAHLLTNIEVSLSKNNLTKIVFLEPVFPERVSGRLGG